MKKIKKIKSNQKNGIVVSFSEVRNIPEVLKRGYLDLKSRPNNLSVDNPIWLIPNKDKTNYYSGIIFSLFGTFDKMERIDDSNRKPWPDGTDETLYTCRIYLNNMSPISYRDIPKYVTKNKMGQKGYNYI